MSVTEGPHPVVAGGGPVQRTPSRSPAQRQPGFDEVFDADTIFFDVVHTGDRLLLSGPPLREFGPLLDRAELLLDGVPYRGERRRLELSRAVRIVLDCPEPPTTFTVRSDDLELTVPVTRADPALFADRRVLVTHSKDNALTWIADWVRFHAVNHGTDAVLFYDNGSTEYELADIDAVVSAVPGIEVVRVISWPFPFGPQGGVWAGDAAIPWDSDFCQIGAMENARFVYLTDAAGVVNADVDELLVAASGVSIYDRLAATPGGYLRYSGHWIESVSGDPDGPGPVPRHADYWVHRPDSGRCLFKWSVVPALLPFEVQWTCHAVYGLPLRSDDDFELAHFRAINLDWKTVRTTPKPYDPGRHHVHLALTAALHRAFPETFVPARLQRLLTWAANDADGSRTGQRQRDFSAALLGLLPEGTVDQHWVWRDSTVVLECSPGGFPIAFDATLSPTTIHLSVVARQAAATGRLTDAVTAVGRPTVGTRTNGVKLGRWMQSGPPLDVPVVVTEVAGWITDVGAHLASRDPA